MTEDMTRRDMLARSGAVVALSMLGTPALAGRDPKIRPPRKPTPELLALKDRVFRRIAELEPEFPFMLEGQYSKLFKRIPSQMAVERKTSMAYTSKGQRPSDAHIWNHESHEIGLGLALPTTADENDINDGIRGLVSAFRELRETEAADVLNNSLVYDPKIGGDGRSLCCSEHPTYSSGKTWSNMFPEYRPLDNVSLDAALLAIRTNWVDERNLKLEAYGGLVVVPVPQIVAAEKTLKTELRPGCASSNVNAVSVMPGTSQGYLVSDYLTSDDNWFIKTNIEGLVWYERTPFEMDAWMDTVTNQLLVKAYERRCFGCNDPRAIFGSVKPTESNGRNFSNELRKQYGLNS